jgi:hypothetical protein
MSLGFARAGGIGCVVNGDVGAPETTRARNVSSVPGSRLPFQERKGGRFMRIYFFLRFRSLFGLLTAKLRLQKGR